MFTWLKLFKSFALSSEKHNFFFSEITFIYCFKIKKKRREQYLKTQYCQIKLSITSSLLFLFLLRTLMRANFVISFPCTGPLPPFSSEESFPKSELTVGLARFPPRETWPTWWRVFGQSFKKEIISRVLFQGKVSWWKISISVAAPSISFEFVEQVELVRDSHCI